MWTETTIAGKPAEIFVPGPGPFAAAVIYLHGYAGESLQDKAALTEAFARRRLPVVRPSGGRGWWLNRIHPEFDSQVSPIDYVTGSVIGWMKENWGVQPPRIGLLGVSMGGQGVLNLAYRRALKYPVVAAISPAVDFDRIHGRGFAVEELFPDAESARQETPVLHLHPLNWPKSQFFCCDPDDPSWFTGCEILASKLRSSGIPFQCDLKTRAGGHSWQYFSAMSQQAVDFLADGLELPHA